MLSTICSVCNARRKFKTMSYDHDLRPYCLNAYSCTSEHPNSLKNIRIRGTHENLLSYEEAAIMEKDRALETYEDTMAIFSSKKLDVNIHRLMTGTLGFRAANDVQAKYICYLMGKLNTTKTTVAMQYLVAKAIEEDAGFIAQQTASRSRQPKPVESKPQVEAEAKTEAEVFEL